MNILKTFCKNILNSQDLFIISLNGCEAKIRQPEVNKFLIEDLFTGDKIDVDECENISCGFAIVSFVYNGEGYDLMVGEIKSLNDIALLSKSQN